MCAHYVCSFAIIGFFLSCTWALFGFVGCAQLSYTLDSEWLPQFIANTKPPVLYALYLYYFYKKKCMMLIYNFWITWDEWPPWSSTFYGYLSFRTSESVKVFKYVLQWFIESINIIKCIKWLSHLFVENTGTVLLLQMGGGSMSCLHECVHSCCVHSILILSLFSHIHIDFRIWNVLSQWNSQF